MMTLLRSKFLFFFTWILFLNFCFCHVYADALTINLFCPANGKGLQADGNILQNALKSNKCIVRWIKNSRDKNHIKPADINLFCEIVYPDLYSLAKYNWFIPNPECYSQDIDCLNGLDLILCRTYEVERIFTALEMKTFFLGFTTVNAQKRDVKRDFNAFLHVAGSNPLKGTIPLVDAWKLNPLFPRLTVVSVLEVVKELPDNLIWLNKRLPQMPLRALQNRCGIHMCLSETEGFGHYLLEAMSIGAVVITTDAPPMNEFISDPRCLIPHSHAVELYLGMCYRLIPESIEEKVNGILRLSTNELQAIGKKNRSKYLEMDRQFHSNLKRLIENTSKGI